MIAYILFFVLNCWTILLRANLIKQFEHQSRRSRIPRKSLITLPQSATLEQFNGPKRKIVIEQLPEPNTSNFILFRDIFLSYIRYDNTNLASIIQTFGHVQSPVMKDVPKHLKKGNHQHSYKNLIMTKLFLDLPLVFHIDSCQGISSLSPTILESPHIECY